MGAATCTWSPCKASTRRPTAAASGPCQRFARNCATRNLAPPHAPIPGSALHLDGCVATGVSARRREPPAHRWHARGQGFKSPQLHPRSEAMFGPGHPGISGLGQQIGSNPACTASPGYRSGRGADRSCRAGTVVQPDAEGRQLRRACRPRRHRRRRAQQQRQDAPVAGDHDAAGAAHAGSSAAENPVCGRPPQGRSGRRTAGLA
jgi:hypothetical protein